MPERDENDIRNHNQAITLIMAISFSLFLGFAIGGFLAPPLQTVNKNEMGWIYQYQSIVGAIVGAAFALFAATIAWIGIQYQIAEQRNLSIRKEIEAHTLFIKKLIDFWRLIDLYWIQIDFGSEIPDRQTEFLVRAGSISLTILDDWKTIEPSIATFIDHMSLEDEANVNVLLNFQNFLLREIERDRNQQIYQATADDRALALFSIRTSLSHFYEALNRFDENEAKIYKERSKNKVNWDPTWMHLKKYYSSEHI